MVYGKLFHYVRYHILLVLWGSVCDPPSQMGGQYALGATTIQTSICIGSHYHTDLNTQTRIHY